MLMENGNPKEMHVGRGEKWILPGAKLGEA